VPDRILAAVGYVRVGREVPVDSVEGAGHPSLRLPSAGPRRLGQDATGRMLAEDDARPGPRGRATATVSHAGSVQPARPVRRVRLASRRWERITDVWRPSGTLRQLLVQHGPALNLLRLLLALLVLVSHTNPLGGFGPDPAWFTVRPSTTFGGFAVGAFFALSGLLVTMSGFRRTPYEFLRSRFLRIVPAYAAVVVLCAFVLAPTIFLADHGTLRGFVDTSATGPFAYVARNMLFPIGLQYAIHDVFATTTPYGLLTGTSAINGSLWTLPMELRCYLVALAIVIVGRGLGRPTLVAETALGLTGALLFLQHVAPTAAQVVTPAWMVDPLPELLFVFLCGAVLGSCAERLVITWRWILAAAAVYVVTTVLGGLWFRGPGLGSLALLLPVIAAFLPKRPLTFFRNDLSYGTYVWAFPVQQTLAYLGLAASRVLFLTVSTVVTLALAAASWFVVERPALRLRHRPAKEPLAEPATVGG
jgi:peptidoglycan/LPS O-acetylase OafA/YrhL